MSQAREEIIKCPNCGTEGMFTIWDSVNVDLAPELKDRIFNEDLFVWTCPECGAKVFISMPFLYHDMGHKLMVFFDFNEEVDPCQEDAMEVPEIFSNFGEYRYRAVHGLMNLKEKIMMTECGLNDVAVEYMKYCIKHLIYPELFEKGDEFRFVTVDKEENSDDSFLVFTIHGKEDCKFPIREYIEYAEKVNTDPRFDASNLVNICEKWVESKLKQIC